MNRITQLTRGKKITIGIVIIVLVVVALLLLFSQTPTIISATVSPEVMVRGQDSQVTVTVKVRPFLFIVPWYKIKAILVAQGDISEYNNFNKVINTLGYLTYQGRDGNGNLIYQNHFTVNHNSAETLQIQLFDNVNKPLIKFVNQARVDAGTQPFIPPMRLAVTTHPAVLPPDPGEAGRQTLEGVDSDKDGLRDDLQREIFFAYPDSERARKALGDVYKGDAKRLELGNDIIKAHSVDLIEALRYVNDSVDKRSFCLLDVKVSPSYRYASTANYLDAVELNTILRQKAGESSVNNTLSNNGKSFLTPEESKLGNCLFDPNSLPD